ncbi:T3SS (YopN, CesT) and YbjN peptide-binding chaperone 1 [Rhodococcus gannanensis]|uniref:YbjN domain-containing protein n=1 Tax=Rhodococcus gannanensis TaxID=1960308 RepID=A0ABW4P1W6_9NOCA
MPLSDPDRPGLVGASPYRWPHTRNGGIMVQSGTFDAAVEGSWREFRGTLANLLAAMSGPDYLIIGAASANFTALSVTVEFQVSDGYLVCVARSLGLSSDAALLDLLSAQGWGPSDRANGVRIDVPMRFADRAAFLAVSFLREVGSIHHPCFIQARDSAGPVEFVRHSDSIATDADSVPPPVEYPADHRELQDAISAALEWKHGTPAVMDEAGDFVITIGGQLGFVLPHPERPQLRILVPLLTAVTGRTRAAELLTELNSDYAFVRLILIGDQVNAAIDLPTAPFSAMQLSDQLNCMAAFLETVDDEFVERFGAQRAGLDEPDSDDQDAELPAGLLTLLHLDPDGAHALDGEEVATVCDFDRDTILEYLHISEEQVVAWQTRADEAHDAGDFDEADACAHESTGWERTVTSLRAALRVVTLGAQRRPNQLDLFGNQIEQPDHRG